MISFGSGAAGKGGPRCVGSKSFARHSKPRLLTLGTVIGDRAMPHTASSSKPSRKLGKPAAVAYARKAPSFQQVKICGPPAQAVRVTVAWDVTGLKTASYTKLSLPSNVAPGEYVNDPSELSVSVPWLTSVTNCAVAPFSPAASSSRMSFSRTPNASTTRLNPNGTSKLSALAVSACAPENAFARARHP